MDEGAWREQLGVLMTAVKKASLELLEHAKMQHDLKGIMLPFIDELWISITPPAPREPSNYEPHSITHSKEHGFELWHAGQRLSSDIPHDKLLEITQNHLLIWDQFRNELYRRALANSRPPIASGESTRPD